MFLHIPPIKLKNTTGIRLVECANRACRADLPARQVGDAVENPSGNGHNVAFIASTIQRCLIHALTRIGVIATKKGANAHARPQAPPGNIGG